jgi:hypothetical protein
MEYKCNYCNKNYASYQSRCNHIRKYHKNDDKQNINNDKHHDKHLINKINDLKTDKKYLCKKCNKSFDFYQIRWRHEKKCKYENKNDKMEIKTLENKINELEKIIKNTKLNNINKINNINNGTINNIHINGVGTEEVIDKLTEKEKLDLLTNLLFKEIPHVELIRKIFNNDKFIEDRNTIISNLQTKTCLAYNNESHKFEAKNKNEHIDNMIYYRHKDIRNIYNEMYDNKKIKDNSRKLIEEYIEQFDNLKNTESYKKHKEEIIYIIYNCKELMKKLKDDLEFDV